MFVHIAIDHFVLGLAFNQPMYGLALFYFSQPMYVLALFYSHVHIKYYPYFSVSPQSMVFSSQSFTT